MRVDSSDYFIRGTTVFAIETSAFFITSTESDEVWSSIATFLLPDRNATITGRYFPGVGSHNRYASSPSPVIVCVLNG